MMIKPAMFGNKCLKAIFQKLCPSARDAKMYSKFFRFKVANTRAIVTLQ